jgi:hypothetical protein
MHARTGIVHHVGPSVNHRTLSIRIYPKSTLRTTRMIRYPYFVRAMSAPVPRREGAELVPAYVIARLVDPIANDDKIHDAGRRRCFESGRDSARVGVV